MERILTSAPACIIRKGAVRTRHDEQVRDPYDALRPWSAITHGAGAMLAVLGAILLLLHSHFAAQYISFTVYGYR